jgi:hypothetical protein
VRVPEHLGAFDGRAEDFEWTRIEPKPSPAVQPGTVSADELSEKMKSYVDSLISKPGWQEELIKKNREVKEAKRRERKLNRKVSTQMKKQAEKQAEPSVKLRQVSVITIVPNVPNPPAVSKTEERSAA